MRKQTKVSVQWGSEGCWIENDSYDRTALAEMVAGSTYAQELIETGNRLLPYFAALAQDIFSLFFKYAIVYRPGDSMPPSSRVNRTLLGAVETGTGYQVLRGSTMLEEEKAGLAAVLVLEEIVALLRSERMLNRRELLDLWRLRESEREAAESGEAARSAADIASGELGEEGRREGAGSDPFRLDEMRARARVRVRAARSAYATDEIPEGVKTELTSLPARVCASIQASSEHLDSWERVLGVVGEGSAGAKLELGRRLAKNSKLRRLSLMVGRMRELASALRRRVLEHASEEVYEIREGVELGRLLPCELVKLRHASLRDDFRRRLVERELLVYGLSGTGRRGRGPMVVCLDCSGSMGGEKELWSKAVALTLLDVARRQRRRFCAVCFSAGESQLNVIEFSTKRGYGGPLAAALDLAEYFPGGGTNFQLPLDTAADRIAGQRLRRADIVLITDGECRVDSEWLEKFRETKRHLGFSLYSVLVDTGPSFAGTLLELSDRVSSISRLTAEGATEIFLSV